MSNVKGLEKLLNNLDKLPKDVRKIVDDVTHANALEIQRNAKAKAPVDLGTLRQSGTVFESSKSKKEIEYSIAFLAKHAAYMEFGTGGLVRIPSELRDLASKFKGKGIRKVNLRPQPVLYPSLIKQSRTYLNDLKDALTPYLKKI